MNWQKPRAMWVHPSSTSRTTLRGLGIPADTWGPLAWHRPDTDLNGSLINKRTKTANLRHETAILWKRAARKANTVRSSSQSSTVPGSKVSWQSRLETRTSISILLFSRNEYQVSRLKFRLWKIEFRESSIGRLTFFFRATRREISRKMKTRWKVREKKTVRGQILRFKRRGLS